MGAKIELLKKAAIRFIHAGTKRDEYFLVEFRNRPEVTLPFTRDADRIEHRIDALEAAGNTALFDSVYLAVKTMQLASNSRKALLIISDGLDNYNRYTGKETKGLVAEASFLIYAINVYSPQYGNRYVIQQRDSGILEELSSLTGGHSFQEIDPQKISSVAERITYEVRHEYVLGYVPTNRSLGGKYHRIRVRVESPVAKVLRIAYRRGYYAPCDGASAAPRRVKGAM